MWTLTTSTGRTIALDHLPVTVGSAADADLTITHPSIEALHVAVSEAEGGQALRVAAIGDAVLGVDGRRVDRGLVTPGARLVIGRVGFTVERRGSAALEPELTVRRAAAPSPEADVPRSTARAPQGAGKRGTALRFDDRAPRRGLLHTDLSQLDALGKLAVVGGILAVVALLAWGVSLLVETLV